jgi:uncharacterized protein (DUF433 family)
MPEAIAALPPDDVRVSRGLFTVAAAAGWLGVPRSTLQAWVHGYERRVPGRSAVRGRPIVLSLPAGRGESVVPFLGLAEGMVLSAFRRTGVPLQRIRPALELLDREMGLGHALASDRLATDGAEVLYEYAARASREGIGELVTVRSGQCVFAPAVEERLRRIEYADDHWAGRLELPGYTVARVVLSPDRAGGRPVLERSDIPVEDVVAGWCAGDSLAELAARFVIEGTEVEDVLRAATRRCAG